ncbi:hypothetical protein [Nocardioides yefusunii]|uniref:Uncharacterized protein n=1 Tax=Nocardioides yefusunii TaxID=2500546 RepID=A0ABW1R2G5_9ACTN|nr:hypothetical protein [Nocardioides yefusunii]
MHLPNDFHAPATPQPLAAPGGALPAQPKKRLSRGKRIGIGVAIFVGVVFAVNMIVGITLALTTALQADDTKATVQSTTKSPAPSASPSPRRPTDTPTARPKPTKSAQQIADEKYAAEMKKAGWKQIDDDVWSRWDEGESDMFFYTFKLRVVSPTGCNNSLYVKGSLLDQGGTVIGFANDVLPGLAANQQAVLELTSYDDNAASIQLDEVSCY